MNHLRYKKLRLFFEDDYYKGLTKTTNSNRYGILNPGDFTPIWETALYSNNEKYAAYDVNIYSERRTSYIQAEFSTNKSKAYRLPVYQKLVIIKNLKTGKLYSYILSLIPNIESHNNKVLKDYKSLKKSNKNYYGLAIYTSTTTSAINRIQKFNKGGKVETVLMNGNSSTLAMNFNKILHLFHNIELSSSKTITTKSGEDWWFEDDYTDDSYYYDDQEYDNFIDWLMTEIWPNAEDGDHFSMNYDMTNDTWYLEDQNGDIYIVPDEVCTGDGSDDDWNDDNVADDNYNDDNMHDDNASLDDIILQVYCPNCEKHLGTANFDNLDEMIFYCDKCKIYVRIP